MTVAFLGIEKALSDYTESVVYKRADMYSMDIYSILINNTKEMTRKDDESESTNLGKYRTHMSLNQVVKSVSK